MIPVTKIRRETAWTRMLHRMYVRTYFASLGSNDVSRDPDSYGVADKDFVCTHPIAQPASSLLATFRRFGRDGN